MPLPWTSLFHLCISQLILALGSSALLLPAVLLPTGDLCGSWLLLAQQGPQLCGGLAFLISKLASEHQHLPTVGPGCCARHLLIIYSSPLLSQMYLVVGWVLTEPNKKKIITSLTIPQKQSIGVPGLTWKSPWRCELQFLPHPSWWQEEKRDAL